jgi:hypothetical protein
MVHRLLDKPNPDHSSEMAGWTWGHVAVVGFLALLIVGTVVINRVANLRQEEREQWPTTTGVPIDTRVEEIPPSRSFIRPFYAGQCLVQYTVAGRRYSVWAGSGYMDIDRKFVEERVTNCPVDHYFVHYNPKQPAESYANRQ